MLQAQRLGATAVGLAFATFRARATPKYTANLRWRQARVLRLMGRTFEAFFAFRRLIDEYPQHVHIEQFRYAAFLQGIECGYVEEAILIGTAYLDEPAMFCLKSRSPCSSPVSMKK